MDESITEVIRRSEGQESITEVIRSNTLSMKEIVRKLEDIIR